MFQMNLNIAEIKRFAYGLVCAKINYDTNNLGWPFPWFWWWSGLGVGLMHDCLATVGPWCLSSVENKSIDLTIHTYGPRICKAPWGYVNAHSNPVKHVLPAPSYRTGNWSSEAMYLIRSEAWVRIWSPVKDRQLPLHWENNPEFSGWSLSRQLFFHWHSMRMNTWGWFPEGAKIYIKEALYVDFNLMSKNWPNWLYFSSVEAGTWS